jgi:hypothetical protein
LEVQQLNAQMSRDFHGTKSVTGESSVYQKQLSGVQNRKYFNNFVAAQAPPAQQGSSQKENGMSEDVPVRDTGNREPTELRKVVNLESIKGQNIDTFV